jgi:hypothetical protein
MLASTTASSQVTGHLSPSHQPRHAPTRGFGSEHAQRPHAIPQRPSEPAGTTRPPYRRAPLQPRTSPAATHPRVDRIPAVRPPRRPMSPPTRVRRHSLTSFSSRSPRHPPMLCRARKSRSRKSLSDQLRLSRRRQAVCLGRETAGCTGSGRAMPRSQEPAAGGRRRWLLNPAVRAPRVLRPAAPADAHFCTDDHP